MTRGDSGNDRLGAARSGVYRVADARKLRQATEALAPEFDVVTISLSGVTSKRELLDRFAVALAFPEWFGGNWDALEDCLSDLSWRDGRGHLLVIEGFEALQAASRDEFAVLLDVLTDAADQWLWQERPFFAVYVDPRRLLGLPAWDEEAA